MTIERTKLENDILQFVRSNCPNRPDVGVATDLVEENILDSLLLLDLIFKVEELCHVRLGSDDVSPSNFRSVATITDLAIEQMRASSAADRAGASLSRSSAA